MRLHHKTEKKNPKKKKKKKKENLVETNRGSLWLNNFFKLNT
jgi:hypothetical protein